MFALRAGLVLAVLVFVPGLFEGFEGPKAALVRVLGLAALAATLVRGRLALPRRVQLVDVAVLAWLAAEALATWRSEARVLSFFGEWRQREGLITSLGLAGLYFASRRRGVAADAPRGTIAIVLAACGIETVYALAQVAGLDPMRWQRTASVAAAGITFARPFGTLGHANLLGVVMAGAAVLAAGRASAPDGAARRWTAARIGAALVAALAGVTVLLSFSRGAWLGTALGLAVMLALRARALGRGAPSRRALGIAIAALVVGMTALGFTPLGRVLAGHITGVFAPGSGSGGSRLEIWKSALAAWRAAPWLGHGPDTFELVFTRYQTARYWQLEWAGLPVHAHSIVLHTLATRGVIGLAAGALWALGLVVAARAAWRGDPAPARRAHVAALVGAIVAIATAGLFGALGIAGAVLLVALSVLLACAAESPRAPAPRARLGALLAGAAALIVAVATAHGALRETLASNAADATREWMTSAPGRAVAAAERAVELRPRDDRLARMLAESLLWQSTTLSDSAAVPVLKRAADEAARAVALVPERAENAVILGRAFATIEAQGDTTARAAAAQAYGLALRMAPMDALTLLEYADHERLMGRPSAALALAERAEALYPARAEVAAGLAVARTAMIDSVRSRPR